MSEREEDRSALELHVAVEREHEDLPPPTYHPARQVLALLGKGVWYLAKELGKTAAVILPAVAVYTAEVLTLELKAGLSHETSALYSLPLTAGVIVAGYMYMSRKHGISGFPPSRIDKK